MATARDARPDLETVAEMRREIGRDLAGRRRNARLTQHELAVKAGYHRSVVGHAEQGRGDAGPAFWARVDTALGTGAHFTAWDARIRAAAAHPATVRSGDGELDVPAELTGPDPEAALAASRRSGWPVRERPGGLALLTGNVVDVCEVPARAGRVAARWWHETGGRADVVRGLPALPPPGPHLAVLEAGERWLFLVRGGACPWGRADLATLAGGNPAVPSGPGRTTP
ncbi:MAG: helix-turn-helix transcriptional regulator, partial [Trebonia sp.]